MKIEYIITNEELCEKGIDLNDYCVDSTKITPLINIALDLCITEILKQNNNLQSEKEIEEELDTKEELVVPFKKLQFRVIYNLLFLGDINPIDRNVIDIIVYDLRWGKINGFQKGVYLR